MGGGGASGEVDNAARGAGLSGTAEAASGAGSSGSSGGARGACGAGGAGAAGSENESKRVLKIKKFFTSRDDLEKIIDVLIKSLDVWTTQSGSDKIDEIHVFNDRFGVSEGDKKGI